MIKKQKDRNTPKKIKKKAQREKEIGYMI